MLETFYSQFRPYLMKLKSYIQKWVRAKETAFGN